MCISDKMSASTYRLVNCKWHRKFSSLHLHNCRTIEFFSSVLYIFINNTYISKVFQTAHGLVERVNKKTLDYLKMLLNQVREMEFEEWHYAIPMVEYIVNTTTHSVTGYAPCTLIFGTQSVEDLQMMSKQGLEMEKLEADKYLRALDANYRELREASILFQDNLAIERHEMSVKDGNADPLEAESYVLKVARPPQHQAKLHLKYTGPYKVVRKLRPDFYDILDLVQDQTETVHRHEVVKCYCENDSVAREEASKDTKELFIEEVISHTGKAQKQGTVEFECKVKGHSKPYSFKFKDCKYVKVIQDYIEKQKSLHYLKSQTISSDSKKRSSKGKYDKTTSVFATIY